MLTAPGWRVTNVYEGHGEGEIQYARDGARLDIHWRPARAYDGYYADREDIGRGATTQLLGQPATMWAYAADDHTVIGPVTDGHFLEVRRSGMDREAFTAMLGSLERMDDAGFEAAVADRAVTPAETPAEIAGILHDVPVPDRFDPASIEVSGFNDRYHVTAATGAVTCAWLEEYAAGNRDAAVEAMAGSREWDALREIVDEGTGPRWGCGASPTSWPTARRPTSFSPAAGGLFPRTEARGRRPVPAGGLGFPAMADLPAAPAYRATGAVCGVPLPAGLEDGSRLPEPIFTPATKAALGDHDENVDFDTVVATVGRDEAEELRRLTLAVYRLAEEAARDRGIVLADTKVEFGRRAGDDAVVLADEVLTPDSSRFWPAADWRPGRAQPSYDKQIVRDWLLSPASGWDRASGEPPPPLPAEVVDRTRARYVEAFELLTGQSFAGSAG